MHVQRDGSPALGKPEAITDHALVADLGVSEMLIAQSRVLAFNVLALDDVMRSGFPGRIGLVQCGDRLIISIGCRDSHGGMTERACAAAAKVLGGPVTWQKSFGGGLFTVDHDSGKVEIMGTSGDLKQIQNQALKQFAADKLEEFIRIHYLNN